MKKDFCILSVYLLLVFSTFSCKEIYRPDIDSDIDAIVIEGQITNEPGPYTIQITRAQYYSETEKNYPVKNANVTIHDDLQNTAILYEKSPGTYVTEIDRITGEEGRFYTLSISTEDGYNYQSTPQLLPPKPNIDSIYAVHEEHKYLYENANGEFRVNLEDGMQIYIDISNPFQEKAFYRFEWKAVVEYFYTKPIGDISGYIYCWKRHYDQFNSNIASDNNFTENKLIKHPLAFRSKDKCLYIDSCKYRHIEGWIFFIDQYALNEEAFIYWQDADEQMEVTGEIFDPLTNQLNGNIKCINDDSKLALGFFEAVSINRIAIFSNIDPNTDEIRAKWLDEVPLVPEDGLTELNPPDFWIFN